ncbi:MAG TPA: cytochrome P450 [Acidimicrobiales bacterium]|nr:cytochrome P450 [Acidimicrobiales bacterium]
MNLDIHDMGVDEAGQVFVTPSAYADDRRFHAACALLRREDPIHLVEHPDFPPFHVVTRHADVYEIELHPTSFANEPVSILVDRASLERARQTGLGIRSLVHMDDPDHRAYRGLTVDWFKPRSLARLDDRLADLARQTVDRMADLGGECDFAREIAMPYPLQVILAILGLPESDYDFMLTLTQELFGAQDPELARSTNPADILLVLQDFVQYFSVLTEDRRACPAEDLASTIANGCPHGEQMPPLELISYYMIIATAGHDTTSSAMAGGVQALVENPAELARLKDDPELIDSAVDEIIRWTTPVKHFMRNCTEPYDVSGHEFQPGDAMLLSYPSANRDEDVFDDPFRFDVGRSPNPHLAFGFGAHYCLGAKLAKMEIKALLTELVPRLDSVELAGEPSLMQTTFVGGLKHLPIRYRLHR